MNHQAWVTRLLNAALLTAPFAMGCKSPERHRPERPLDRVSFETEPFHEHCFTRPPAPRDAGAESSAVDAGTCPSAEEAKRYLPPTVGQAWEVRAWPTESNGECCYAARTRYFAMGRPFSLPDGEALMALDEPRSGWARVGVLAPCLTGLSASQRDALSAEWLRDALLEQASIASFGRVGLELLLLGAPANLVAGAHQAALDEVSHASLCFGLASAYARTPLGPGKLELGASIILHADLNGFAMRTAREGCVGETIAAIVAAEQLEYATDAAVRATLETIVRDETEHAEMAWATIGWAIRVGGADTRSHVLAAFADALREPTLYPDHGIVGSSLRAHGRLSHLTLKSTKTEAISRVILPCVSALEGSHPS